MTSTEASGPSRPPTYGEPAFYGGDPLTSANGARPEQSLRDLARRIARRRLLLASITAAVFIPIAIWAFVATPRYRSNAQLRIEFANSGAGAMLGEQLAAVPGAGLLGLGRDELETEIGVLHSDRITDAMIDSLALGVRLESPAGNRAAILSARVVNPSVDVAGTLTFERRTDGRYSVSTGDFDQDPHVPRVVAAGTEFRVGGQAITLNPRLATSGPHEVVIDILPRYQVHKLLDRRLYIAKADAGSRLVDLRYEDPDRVLAAQVLQRIIDEYRRYSTTTEQTLARNDVAELRYQIDTTARRLTAAEVALRDFEERSRLIAPEEQATEQVKRVAAISMKVDALTVERNALARMLAIIDRKSRGGEDASAYRQLATFPSLITNRAIQDLLQSLVELENKRSALGVRRTAENPEYQQLTNRITEIEGQLYQLGPQYLESLDQQLATTARTVSALTDTLQAMPGAAMQYGRLLRDRTVLETTYVMLQKQLKLAELKDVLRQDKVRVIDAPRVANVRDKAFPRRGVMLALGLLLGAALAVTLALFLELWNGPEYVRP